MDADEGPNEHDEGGVPNESVDPGEVEYEALIRELNTSQPTAADRKPPGAVADNLAVGGPDPAFTERTGEGAGGTDLLEGHMARLAGEGGGAESVAGLEDAGGPFIGAEGGIAKAAEAQAQAEADGTAGEFEAPVGDDDVVDLGERGRVAADEGPKDEGEGEGEPPEPIPAGHVEDDAVAGQRRAEARSRLGGDRGGRIESLGVTQGGSSFWRCRRVWRMRLAHSSAERAVLVLCQYPKRSWMWSSPAMRPTELPLLTSSSVISSSRTW